MTVFVVFVIIVTVAAAAMFGAALAHGARWHAAPLGLAVLVGLALLTAIAAEVTR